jgi:isochorismate synthase
MLLSQKIDLNLPFVIYKNPGSGKLSVWQQLNSDLITDKSLQTHGYYFSPFDDKKHPVIVFPAKQSKVRTYLVRKFNDDFFSDFSLQLKPEENEAVKHKEKVNKAIEYINKGIVNKVIISRSQEVFVKHFNKFAFFLRLAKHYDDAYVYLWHHPLIGTWAGASPEKLGIYSEGVFSTVALAGTLPAKDDVPVIWTQKEIQEQQFVTDYIVQRLSAYGNVKQTVPKTVFQGKMAHIKTAISVPVSQEQVSDVVRLLHPTPAVCGLPLQKAQKIINEIENYDRLYYTGFLGRICGKNAGLYVNLRCMQILPNKIVIYTGGGIVSDSIPENEWKETQIKASILLSLLK